MFSIAVILCLSETAVCVILVELRAEAERNREVAEAKFFADEKAMLAKWETDATHHLAEGVFAIKINFGPGTSHENERHALPWDIFGEDHCFIDKGCGVISSLIVFLFVLS